MKILGQGRNWTDIKDRYGAIVRLMTIKPAAAIRKAQRQQAGSKA